LIVVPGDHRRYGAMSRRVMGIVRTTTTLIEQISIDEAFLDVTGLSMPADQIARMLQQRIRDELKLPCSLGVASNKLVAKIANNVGKARSGKSGEPPQAILVVRQGDEAKFLAPLATKELWGVGPKTEERLAQLGLRTIGDIAAIPDDELATRFGKHGADLSRRAKGIDDRSVVTYHKPKSVSQERTYIRDVSDVHELHRTLRRLSAGVARQLKRKRLTGTTVRLKLRWSDFTTPTRQTTLDRPTDDEDEIYRTVIDLFERLWTPGRPVRLLGAGVGGLGKQARQMSLWDAPDERAERLQAAVRRVRQRYGDGAIRRGDELPSDDDDLG
jgi:DNA polymerase-4